MDDCAPSSHSNNFNPFVVGAGPARAAAMIQLRRLAIYLVLGASGGCLARGGSIQPGVDGGPGTNSASDLGTDLASACGGKADGSYCNAAGVTPSYLVRCQAGVEISRVNCANICILGRNGAVDRCSSGTAPRVN